MSNNFENSALIPASKAAGILGVDPRTFVRWLREGKLNGIKLAGGSWFVHPAILAQIRHQALVGQTIERCV